MTSNSPQGTSGSAGDGPSFDLGKLSLSTVDTRAEMFGEVEFPIELPPAPDLEAFSMEHWIYLAAKGLAPAAPTQLSPFPLPLHSAESYERNLREWDLVDGNGNPYPDLLELMDKLTNSYAKAVWGTVRFPLRAHERNYEFDAESANWGIAEHQIVVPRIPFLITWTRGGELVSATSSETGMTVNRRPATDNYLTDFAEEIRAILDPTDAWGPRSVPTIRVTRAFADDLASVPALGRLDSATDSGARTRALYEVADRHGVDRDTAIRLNALLEVRPAVIAEFLVTDRRGDGLEYTPEETSGTLVFFSDEEGGVLNVHSPHDTYGGRVVVYEPGTLDSLVRSIKTMFIDAANASRP